MRKLFWFFMMLLLAGCGSGGGTTAANSPSASGKGGLSLELVQSGSRVAKTVAGLPVTQPGRLRIVLNETTTNYRKVVDRAFLEPLGTIELPVGNYRVEAIFYESGTPNVLTAYGIYKTGAPAAPATLTIAAGSNTAAAVAMEDIAVVMPPTPAVVSGATYDVGIIAATDLAAKGLQDKWSLTASTSEFTGRKHLSQPATAIHTGLTAPVVGQPGNLYFQGEFFIKSDLLDAGESANNWAFFTEAQTTLDVPTLTIPVDFTGTLPNDTQAPVVKAFNVPSAKQPTETVSQISIVGADNGGIKEYAITTTAGAATVAELAAMTAPATGWSSTPSFTLNGTVDSTDQTVYLYAWVKDFSGNVSSQVDGVTNRKIVFNNSPVVTSFTVPVTTVMDSNSIPVTIVAKGYPTSDGLQCTITETATLPASPAWSAMNVSPVTGTASLTTSYNASIAQSAGVKSNVSLYAWVKDSADRVSPAVLRTVTVNDSPQITALAATGAATGNTVTITRLEATALLGRNIDGYCLTSTSVKPAASAFTTSSGVPSPSSLSYTFTTGITSTNPTTRAVYVWLKDDAGAISSPRGVYVSLSAPTVTP